MCEFCHLLSLTWPAFVKVVNFVSFCYDKKGQCLSILFQQFLIQCLHFLFLCVTILCFSFKLRRINFERFIQMLSNLVYFSNKKISSFIHFGNIFHFVLLCYSLTFFRLYRWGRQGGGPWEVELLLTGKFLRIRKIIAHEILPTGKFLFLASLWCRG